MTEAFDPYAILGVAREADAAAVSAAYRAAAKRVHPDAGGTPDAFARVKRAFDLLLDPQRRARFDATGIAADDAADNSDVAALNLLSALVADLFGTVDYDLARNDVAKDMREMIAGRIDKIEREKKPLYARRERGQSFVKRLSGEGGTLLQKLAAARLAEVDRALASLDMQIAQLRRAKQLIKDAHYSFEKPARTTNAYGHATPWMTEVRA